MAVMILMILMTWLGCRHSHVPQLLQFLLEALMEHKGGPDEQVTGREYTSARDYYQYTRKQQKTAHASAMC
jgi:hypothetical protein